MRRTLSYIMRQLTPAFSVRPSNFSAVVSQILFWPRAALNLSARAAAGMTTMISDKINQWTLLVGMLPLAMSFGAGGLMALPLDSRQHEEFFLTAAQSLFGLALLLRLRLGLSAASALAALFIAQVTLAFVYREDEPRTIVTLTWLGWAYIGLAAAIAASNVARLKLVWSGLFGELRSPVAARSNPGS